VVGTEIKESQTRMETKEIWNEGEDKIQRNFNQQPPPKNQGTAQPQKHKTTYSMQQRNHIKNIYLRNAETERP
jgi:hypothetical protein